MANMAILLCFIPFLFLSWKKMRKDKAYWLVGIYWLANGLINLPNLDIDLFTQPGNTTLHAKLEGAYNLLQTPLVLLLFFHASTTRKRKNHILGTLLLFIVLELGLVGWKGYNSTTCTMIIGTGLVVILAYCINGLMQYMKQMEHTAFENSMVFVYAALLFAYCSFTIIYIFMHIQSGNLMNSKDSFLLYCVGLFLASVITSLGLWSYGIRKRTRGRYSSSSS